MTTGEGLDKWKERYRSADGADKAPSQWLVEAAMNLPSDTTLVDVAGGLGRHARPLVEAGRQVVIVDFVEGALASARRSTPQLMAVVADAWSLPFADGSLDALLVANFLERELFPVFLRLLRPGGHLLYETYTLENADLVAAGKARAPRSPRYMLAPGELRQLVAPMKILRYREGIVEDAAGVRASASVFAQKI
jgi:SAM-dependent methyltransferase